MTAPALLVLPLRMGTGKVPIQQVIFGFLWENRWFRALILRLAQLREWLSMPSLQRGLQRAEQITVRHAFVPNTIQIIMQRFCLIQTDITLTPSTIQPLIKCDWPYTSIARRQTGSRCR